MISCLAQSDYAGVCNLCVCECECVCVFVCVSMWKRVGRWIGCDFSLALKHYERSDKENTAMHLECGEQAVGLNMNTITKLSARTGVPPQIQSFGCTEPKASWDGAW